MSSQQSFEQEQPEFSRVVRLDALSESGSRFEWTASDAERAALVARFGIVALHALTAKVLVRRTAEEGAVAEISFAADVEQRSVISLETVPEHAAEMVTVRYLPADKVRALDAAAAEEGIEASYEEDIEPITGETIDIGETIAQQLSLALDPYPKQAGERLEDYWDPGEDDAQSGERNPFGVLRNLKQNT